MALHWNRKVYSQSHNNKSGHLHITVSQLYKKNRKSLPVIKITAADELVSMRICTVDGSFRA